MPVRLSLYGAFAAIVLVGLPGAAAQGPTDYEVGLEFDGPLPGPIAPEEELAFIPGAIFLRFPAGHTCTEPLTVSATVVGPPYATAVLNPSSHTFTLSEAGVPMSSGPGTEVRIATDLFVTVTREAPAFEAGEYRVDVSVTNPDAPTRPRED